MTPEQHADAILRAASGSPLDEYTGAERTAILAAVTAAMDDGRAELAAENARLREEVESLLRDNALISEAVKQAGLKAARLRAHADGLAWVLEWYAEQVAGCRKVTSEGNEARHQLDSDGGKRARTAIAKHREMKW